MKRKIFEPAELRNMSNDFMLVHTYYCEQATERMFDGVRCNNDALQLLRHKYKNNLNLVFLDRWEIAAVVFKNVLNSWKQKIISITISWDLSKRHVKYDHDVLLAQIANMHANLIMVEKNEKNINKVEEDDNVIIRRVRAPFRHQIL